LRLCLSRSSPDPCRGSFVHRCPAILIDEDGRSCLFAPAAKQGSQCHNAPNGPLAFRHLRPRTTSVSWAGERPRRIRRSLASTPNRQGRRISLTWTAVFRASQRPHHARRSSCTGRAGRVISHRASLLWLTLRWFLPSHVPKVSPRGRRPQRARRAVLSSPLDTCPARSDDGQMRSLWVVAALVAAVLLDFILNDSRYLKAAGRMIQEISARLLGG